MPRLVLLHTNVTIQNYSDLRYTPLSRLSFFSSANNINQDLRPGSDGEWDAYKAGDGVLSFKIAGLDWFPEKYRQVGVQRILCKDTLARW